MEWISVHERLPERGDRVLGYSVSPGDIGDCAIVFIDDDGKYWELDHMCIHAIEENFPGEIIYYNIYPLMHDNGEAIRGVTHWMPLPKSPNGHGESWNTYISINQTDQNS